MAQRRDDFGLSQVRAVIALDQERHMAAIVEVPGPAHRLVEAGKFLEQCAVLLQRGDGFRAARSAVNPVCHDDPHRGLVREHEHTFFPLTCSRRKSLRLAPKALLCLQVRLLERSNTLDENAYAPAAVPLEVRSTVSASSPRTGCWTLPQRRCVRSPPARGVPRRSRLSSGRAPPPRRPR